MAGLDPTTGALRIDSGDVLAPDLTRTAFLASALARDAETLVFNAPYASWQIRCSIDGRPFSVGLFFEEERLTMLIAALDDPAFGASWAEWTREGELRRKSAHEAWLATVDPAIGDGREYPWGIVSSVFDAKSGGSEIVLRYDARLPERPTESPIRFDPPVSG